MMSAGFRHVTTEPTTEVTLGLGAHRLTLKVVDDAGVVSQPDTVLVTVEQSGIPAISYINPEQGHRGDVLDVTLVGANIENPTAVKVFRGDEEDSRIIVSIRPGAAGGKLPITLTILEHAMLGPRLIEVTTPYGVATTRFTVITVEQPRLLSILPSSLRPNGRRRAQVRVEGDNLENAAAVNFLVGEVRDPWVAAEVRQANRDFLDLDVWVSADAAFGKRNFTVSTGTGTASNPPGRSLSIMPGFVQFAIMVLALVPALLYITSLSVNLGYIWMGLGFVILLVLHYLPVLQASSWRPITRFILLAFAVIVIIAWAVTGNKQAPIAYVRLALEIGLIAFLLVEQYQAVRKR